MAAGSTYTPIATTTLSGSVASYTFSSIPSTYTDLVLMCTVTPSTNGYFGGVFNSDTSALYSDTVMWGVSSGAQSFRYSGTTASRFGYSTTANTSMKTFIANFINYSNSTTFKTVLTRGIDSAATGAVASLYRSTSPITSIQVFFDNGANIVAGSTLSLYGITAA